MKKNKIGIILTGGYIENSLLQEYLVTHEILWVIAVDKGLMTAHELGLPIDVIIGDFDSVDKDVLASYQSETGKQQPTIITLKPEKDMTDTEVALEYGIDLMKEQAGEIVLFGATGTRMDHMLANISLLMIPLSKGVKACILDRNNKIYLEKKGFTINKTETYGNYVSLLPMNDQVTGLTLEGFKYPLTDYTLTQGNSLGVSNEIVANTATVSLATGTLIVIEARD